MDFLKRKKKKRAPRLAGAYPARRNMDVSGALVRCALACSAFILATGALAVSGAAAAMPQWALLLVQSALTLLCFGFPAAHGLLLADGDQTDKLSRQALGAGQLRYLALTGVLLVCPMTLMSDLLMAMFSRFGLSRGTAAAAPEFALFLPMVFKSVLIAPVCEELFFRGYLLAALREAGGRAAALITALFFALVHGVDVMLLPRFLLGLLLYALMTRADSLLAPIIVHAAYNLTILLLSFSGLGALFSGLGLVSCLIRVLGCAAFFAALQEAYLARGARRRFEWAWTLSERQRLVLFAGLAALLIAPILVALT